MAISGESINLLRQIGLNQYESKIYIALLTAGTASAGELSEKSNVPRSRVYDVLDSLEKKGFAIMHAGRPIKYIAISPTSIIDSVKSNYERDYEKKLKWVEKLESRIVSELEGVGGSGGEAGENVDDLIGVLRGNANIYNRVKRMIEDSQKSVVKVTDQEGIKELTKRCEHPLKRANKRGVDTKILTHAKHEDIKDFHKKIKDHVNFKTIDKHTGRFIVSDGKEALLFVSPKNTGLWIKSQYLSEGLERLFDHAWRKGVSIGN